MSKLDLLRFLESYDGETEIADFTPAELQELIEKLRRGDEPLPLTKEEFKKKYFEYYDDVKDKSMKRQDW